MSEPIITKGKVQNGTPEGLEFEIECEQEAPPNPFMRWLAEVPSMPGVMAYGETREEACRAVVELAQARVHEQLENGE